MLRHNEGEQAMRRNRTLDKPRYQIIINLIILTTSNETPSQTSKYQRPIQ